MQQGVCRATLDFWNSGDGWGNVWQHCSLMYNRTNDNKLILHKSESATERQQSSNISCLLNIPKRLRSPVTTTILADLLIHSLPRGVLGIICEYDNDIGTVFLVTALHRDRFPRPWLDDALISLHADWSDANQVCQQECRRRINEDVRVAEFRNVTAFPWQS